MCVCVCVCVCVYLGNRLSVIPIGIYTPIGYIYVVYIYMYAYRTN